MPNSFRMPEGGPVDVMDSDEALLASRPAPVDYDYVEIPVKQSLPKQALEWVAEHSTAAAYMLQSLPKQALEWVAEHPTAAAYMLTTGWGAGLADAIAPLDTYTKQIGVRLGSPMELLEHLDEHPEDWLHLIPGRTKLQDMIENPEDYPE